MFSDEDKALLKWVAEQYDGEIIVKSPTPGHFCYHGNIVSLRVGEWRNALGVGKLSMVSICQAVSLLDEWREDGG